MRGQTFFYIGARSHTKPDTSYFVHLGRLVIAK